MVFPHQRSFVLAVALLGCSSPALASNNGWDQASDIARAGLVAAALGVPAVQEDWQGAKQAAFSLAGSYAVTKVLKWSISEERPDKSGDDSFPSGHSSSSFAAAATLHRRYGWEVGLPAHAVATFVAVARVKADKHHAQDVIVGALIGEASGWLFTRPANENVQFLPWGGTHGAGATVAMRF